MIDKIYFDMVADYFATASEEEKRNFINSHRSFEHFYLKNGYFSHKKDYQESVFNFLSKFSGLFNEVAVDVGLEDAETYYPRITKELMEQHRLQEEKAEQVKENVDALVPSYA